MKSRRRGRPSPPTPSARAKARKKERRRRRKGDKYGDRRSSWLRVAGANEGELVPGVKAQQDEILVPHRHWLIQTDTYVASNGQTSQTYTRVRGRFVANDGFELKVYRSNVLTRLAKRFGSWCVTTGDSLIDHKYVVRGRPAGRVRSFFMDGRMRSVLRDQQSCRLEVKRLPRKERKAHGDRVRQVHIQTTGAFIEEERVAGLIELCRATLDRLETSGSASRERVQAKRHYGSPRW